MSKILNYNAKFEMFQFDHDNELRNVFNLDQSYQCSERFKKQRRDYRGLLQPSVPWWLFS